MAPTRSLTARFYTYTTLGASFLFLAMMSRYAVFVLLAAPMLGLVVASFVDGWWPQVDVNDVTMSATRAVEGDTVVLSFVVTTERPVPWVAIDVLTDPHFVPITPLRLVGPVWGSQPVNVQLGCQRWGVGTPNWITIVTQDRFGMTEATLKVPVAAPVSIFPPTERLKSLIPLTRDREMSGEHRSRSKGSGTELAEVRDYRQGDTARSINVRLSARRGRPVVVERHPDRASDVVLVVDSAQDLGAGLNTSLRFTVMAAMALSQRHLRAQDRVGVLDFGYGVRWLEPRLGRRHAHRVVSALLSVQALQKSSAPPTRAPLGAIPKKATVVALTPLLSPAVMQTLVELRSRGQDLLVVEAPIAPSYPQVEPLAERIFRIGKNINRQWLINNGVTIVPWSDGEAIEPVVRRVGANYSKMNRR